MRNTFLILTLFMGIFALFCLDSLQTAQWHKQKDIRLGSVVEMSRIRLENTIESRFHTVEALSTLFILHPDTGPGEFKKFSSNLLRFNPSVRALQYADTDTRVTYVYPAENNKITIQEPITLIEDPKRAPFVKKAIEKQSMVLQGPFELRQGGQGVVLRFPIFSRGRFLGLSIGVYDIPVLVSEALAGLDENGFSFRLKDGKGDIFWKSGKMPKEFKKESFSVADTTWTVQAGWTNSPDPPAFIRILIWLLGGGFLLSALYTVRLYWKQEQHLESTVRQRTQELSASNAALKESEKKYRMLYEDAAIGIFHSTFDGRFLDVNPSLAKMLGYETAEEVVNSIYSIAEQIYVKPRHRDETLERLLAKGETIKVENRYLRKDGSEWDAYVHLRYVSDSKGDPMYLEGFVEDITDRKRMEEELKESKTFLDNMSDVAYITDDQGNLLWVNSAAEQLTGMSREQIISKPFLPLFMEAEHSSLVDAYQRTLKGVALEHVSTLKTGITCHFTSLPKYDKQGCLIGTFGVARDITERLKNEKERLEMEKKAQQAEKAESLSRMAGAVAHHFNNMMFAIIGNLDIARDELPAGTDVAENIANAEESANKAAKMSRFMLTYLGQERRHFTPIDLSAVCSQYLESLQKELPKKIKLYTHFPFSGLIIKADQEQIQQILKATIANSVESMEDQKDCSIKVSIEKTEADKIRGETCFPKNWESSTDEYVLLKISDTGKGIDKKARELIFDPFYTDKFTGRGLGLAMVLGIVSGHGGCITVDSTVGKGTILRVFLPLSVDHLTHEKK